MVTDTDAVDAIESTAAAAAAATGSLDSLLIRSLSYFFQVFGRIEKAPRGSGKEHTFRWISYSSERNKLNKCKILSKNKVDFAPKLEMLPGKHVAVVAKLN